jgi:hypothetical protein
MTKKEWKPVCTCSENVPYKDCMLHSCPCGCDMSIADVLYEYYHSDLKDRYTLQEYIKAEFAEGLNFIKSKGI